MDLRNMTVKEAFRAAKEASGLTFEEIAARSGCNLHSLRHAAHETIEYGLRYADVPAICEALGNTILLQWLEAKTERPSVSMVSPAQSRADVLVAVSRSGAALGDVQRMVADMKVIRPEDARELRSALMEVVCACRDAAAQLQPLAAARGIDECPALASLRPTVKVKEEDETEAPRTPWWKRLL